MTSARFSRIVIIQSLSVDESPTGRQLRDAIELTARFDHQIPVELVEARSAGEFRTALGNVQKTTENPMDYPILHLECHGDKAGLSLGDGSLLPWVELKIELARLNQATRCNLFVSLAACYGARLVETLNVSDRAPCWGLMGPSGTVSPDDLVGSYSAFFLELLHSQNTVAALSSLRDSPACKAKYFLFTAEDNFRKVFQIYRETCSTNTQRVERAERFAQIFQKHGKGMPGFDVSSVGSLLDQEEQKILGSFYRKYFFVDLFPENQHRFSDATTNL